MIKHTVNPDGTVGNVQIIKEDTKDKYLSLYDIAKEVNGTIERVRTVRYSLKDIEPAYLDINNKHFFTRESADKIIEMYHKKYTPHFRMLPKVIDNVEDNFINKHYVKLTKKEYDKLIAKHGKEIIDRKILEMEEWLRINKRRGYKDYYLALNNWVYQDFVTQKPNNKTDNEENNSISSVDIIKTKINDKWCLIFKAEDGITYIATEWQELGI